MARIKKNPALKNLSAKIGGQSIARTQRGNYVRNITQTNTSPTLKQSLQRFTTAHLTTLYSSISAQDKSKWASASLDYKKINRKGILVTRNGFETYLFINQNLLLVDEMIRSTPPQFKQVEQPDINIKSILINELEISTAVKNFPQTYLIFGQPYMGRGETMNFGKGLIIGKITQAQLENKINILPLVKTSFPGIIGNMTIGFYLSAIITNNGNREQFPEMYQAYVLNIS